MKRIIASLAALAAVTACQDSTSPSPLPSEEPTAQLAEADAVTTVRQVWAVVNQNGTLARGSRVTSVAKLGTGQYEVTFNRSVTGCAYIGTTTNAYSQALGIFTASGHLSSNGVFVETKNQGGGLTDGPFNLVVACGPLNTRFAVVGYTGNLVRSTAGTVLTPLGSGRYSIRFSSAVGGCGYFATVADPGNGLVFAPSGVYTGKGADANTVYIETKNPGGGLQSGVPFHLAIICSGTGSSRFAVIKASGDRQRGSTVTTTSRASTGTYVVTTTLNPATCATVATRGSVNTAVPFAPATVEVLPGLNASSVRFQVRQLLFFGGALSNQAIHTAIVC